MNRIFAKVGCAALQVAIVEGHAAFISLYDKTHRMTADLGVTIYSNLTLVTQLENYKTKISYTKDALIALDSTSVGETMYEIEDPLCDMNVFFAER